MATKPIPLLTTGRGEQIGQVVNDNLKPEYEGSLTPTAR
jgi:hypothetical protein